MKIFQNKQKYNFLQISEIYNEYVFIFMDINTSNTRRVLLENINLIDLFVFSWISYK